MIMFLSPQVTPRTETPVNSVSNSLENALHTSAHSTEESLPKRPVGKHSKGESVRPKVKGKKMRSSVERRSPQRGSVNAFRSFVNTHLSELCYFYEF